MPVLVSSLAGRCGVSIALRGGSKHKSGRGSLTPGRQGAETQGQPSNWSPLRRILWVPSAFPLPAGEGASSSASLRLRYWALIPDRDCIGRRGDALGHDPKAPGRQPDDLAVRSDTVGQQCDAVGRPGGGLTRHPDGLGRQPDAVGSQNDGLGRQPMAWEGTPMRSKCLPSGILRVSMPPVGKRRQFMWCQPPGGASLAALFRRHIPHVHRFAEQ